MSPGWTIAFCAFQFTIVALAAIAAALAYQTVERCLVHTAMTQGRYGLLHDQHDVSGVWSETGDKVRCIRAVIFEPHKPDRVHLCGDIDQLFDLARAEDLRVIERLGDPNPYGRWIAIPGEVQP